MKKILLISLLVLPALIFGQKKSYQEDCLGMMTINKEQVTSLAAEMQGDVWDWRPMEGVKSTKETLIHIAQANYFLGSSMGQELPEEINMSKLETDYNTYDEVMDLVNSSYAFAAEAVNNQLTKKTMSDMVELSFGSFTKRGLSMLMLGHGNDHKGTLVAYARMNGIVPPWSR